MAHLLSRVALAGGMAFDGAHRDALVWDLVVLAPGGQRESFVKTLKRDYAKLANRPDSQTAMAQLPKWFDDDNFYHPHSTLGYMPPGCSGKNER